MPVFGDWEGSFERKYVLLVDHEMSAFELMGIYLLPIKLPFLKTPWNHNEGGKCDFRKRPGEVGGHDQHLSKGSKEDEGQRSGRPRRFVS